MLKFYEKSLKDIDYLIKKIKDTIYSPVAEVTVFGSVTPEPVPFAQRQQGTPVEFKKGESWGKLWDCAWVNVCGTIPESARSQHVVLHFDCGGESLIYDRQGNPIRGLTNVDSTFETSLGLPGKTVWQLTAENCPNGKVDLWLDLACNDLFGNLGSGTLDLAEIAVCHDELRALYYDAWVLFDLLKSLDAESPRYRRLVVCLEQALDLATGYSDDAIAAARQCLATELNKKGGDPTITVTGIGHAHIDLAWLWPLRETKRKGARTFSTALDLLARYPDYHFGASQPQLFQWIKEDHPQLFERVKQQVKAGRFEIQGDMWVEPDMNVPSGESLVRQFIYGRQFWQQEFSQVTNMLWLPDVFGYNANLPQIMKKSGIDYFMTQKLSWNEHNKFPHHTFIWHGIDGTGVLTHMLPEENYNSPAAPRGIKFIEKNYQDAGVCDSALMLFGIGDGGGGPGPEHLERLQRIKDLNGISPVKQGKACDFFHHIAKDQRNYPHYKGELYLEKHQGTLTTQARNKFYNRKMENALRELEFAASRMSFYTQAAYPVEQLRQIWQEVLLYQFHDILPGSSIKRVYDESVARYAILLAEVEQLTQHYLTEFAEYCAVPAGNTVAHNITGFAREAWVAMADGYRHITLPAFGYTELDNLPSPAIPAMTVQNTYLENEVIRIVFNAQGNISEIIDTETGKSVLRDNTLGNQLAVYDDICGNCWDIDITWRDRTPEYFVLSEVTSRQEGPLAIVEQHYRYGNSTLQQTISLTPGSKLITFTTTVDWHENLKMLRTSFDVAVFSDDVNCDIQFGKFKRSTLTRNVYDAAQFEICAHKWIDYSERDYGVALINDCKYGHYAKNGILDLNLLRSQNSPGVDADRGQHTFSYALFPHCGDEVEGQVNREAYLFNNPVKLCTHEGSVTGSNHRVASSFIRCDSPHVCVETIKQTEAGEGLALRLYEFDGCHTQAMVTLDPRITQGQLCNLMEENGEPVTIKEGKVMLTFTPFEIKTLVVSVE